MRKHAKFMALAVAAAALVVTTAIQAGPGHDHGKKIKDAIKTAEGDAHKMSDKVAKNAAKLAKKMAKAESPLAPGKIVPDFELTDTEGKVHRLSDYLAAGNTVVLEWFNPDCPFVKKHHMKTNSMARTSNGAMDNGAVWLAINSGGDGKQGHGLKRNQKAREDYEIGYPILIDEKGQVGKLYKAKTTPHMFIISPDAELLYHGAIDNNRDVGKLGDVNHVLDALNLHFDGKKIEVSETKPYGCSVKYAS